MPLPATPALTFGLALAAGMAAQALAYHLRVPGIVLLLAAGVLLGPEVMGWIHPDTLGGGLEIIVGMSVAVILFEGGLNLKISRIKHEAGVIQWLITGGVLVTGLGGALLSHGLMGWGWELSAVFGALITGTGSTVVSPLLKRVKIDHRLATILEGEAILIDPISAILSVVTLEVVLATAMPEAATQLLGLPTRLVVGVLVGALGGWVIDRLIRLEEQWGVPEGMESVFTLGSVLALFAVSETLSPDSGAMAALAAGFVMGNLETPVEEKLKEFKEQMTVLLIGLLFVLLAATVSLQQVQSLGWPGLGVVLGLMLLVRPLCVALSTLGSGLDWQRKVFMSWLAPRGIIAASVASLFAHRLVRTGMEGGGQLQALVFLVIAGTVVLGGLGARPLSRFLGVDRPSGQGYVIVGANTLGLMVARLLQKFSTQVVMVDANPARARRAQQADLEIIHGDIREPRTQRQARLETRRGLVTLTPNEGTNLLLARELEEDRDIPDVLVALDRSGLGSQPSQVEELKGGVLFDRPVALERWTGHARSERLSIQCWSYQGENDGLPAFGPIDQEFLLPVVLLRGGQARLIDHRLRPCPGDRVYYLWPPGQDQRSREWLQAQGWRFEAEIDFAPTDRAAG